MKARRRQRIKRPTRMKFCQAFQKSTRRENRDFRYVHDCTTTFESFLHVFSITADSNLSKYEHYNVLRL